MGPLCDIMEDVHEKQCWISLLSETSFTAFVESAADKISTNSAVTNPATHLRKKFLFIMRRKLFMGVNEMCVKIIRLPGYCVG